MGTRAATALAELFVIALVPALVLPAASPAIGETYSVAHALVHGVCLFLGGAVLFSVTFLLSTIFADVWRPALLVLCAAVGLSFAELLIPELSRIGLFQLMSGESYFRRGAVPWLGLSLSVLASAGLLGAAVRNIARRDF